MDFTHFDREGNARMVDVGAKTETEREAAAQGKIYMSRECFSRIREGSMGKGDVLGVARVAGIMGAKRTCELIPLCHGLNLTNLTIDYTFEEEPCAVRAVCRARCRGKTGVEMEALTGVSVCLLTVYDMCKAADRSMVLGEICLLEKKGGKSGHYRRERPDEGQV